MIEKASVQTEDQKENLLLLRVVIIIFFLVGTFFALVYINKNLTNELSRLVLSYLDVVVWPIVVISIILIFKKNIEIFLDSNRLDSAGPGGLGFRSILSSEQIIKAPPDPKKVKNFEEIAEKVVGEDVVKGEEYQGLINTLNLELEFERIYNIIFKSQINLLRKLRIGDITWSELSGYFYLEQRKNVFLYKDWNESVYIDFLSRSGLISVMGKDGNIKLTPKGDVFLSYIDHMGYQKFGI